MNKIVYLHESELTKLKGLVANGEKKIAFETRGEEPLMVDVNVDAGNFKFDLADVIMYAIDNRNHELFITCYENSTCVTIKPVKEKRKCH